MLECQQGFVNESCLVLLAEQKISALPGLSPPCLMLHLVSSGDFKLGSCCWTLKRLHMLARGQASKRSSACDSIQHPSNWRFAKLYTMQRQAICPKIRSVRLHVVTLGSPCGLLPLSKAFQPLYSFKSEANSSLIALRHFIEDKYCLAPETVSPIHNGSYPQGTNTLSSMQAREQKGDFRFPT